MEPAGNECRSVKEWRVALSQRFGNGFGPRLRDEMAGQACGVPQDIVLRHNGPGDAASLPRAREAVHDIHSRRAAPPHPEDYGVSVVVQKPTRIA